MKSLLDAQTYCKLQETISSGKELTYDIASGVARAMKDWALSKGATHFTHWFQPMTGSTAEKYNSFLEKHSYNAEPIAEFSGKSLIKGEADGSSFPSGGLRATFEARGYTTWDCTSPAFFKRDEYGTGTLCIPTAFCSFSGEALDEKTPLLRSMDAISKQAVRLLRLLGDNETERVIPTVGGEQEYFLIDRSHFLKRKDLVYTGRTLFGTPPSKGQELADQYYAATPDRVAKFMRELDAALWRLGVPAKTEHNEAAPSQFELAPLFASANVATDHNQIIMEQMRRVADRNGLTCLLHEKPFANVNGNGKHNNWSLATDKGKNLLKPGKTQEDNCIFHTFFVAVLAAVDEYAGALRMACATLGNEHRLGGFEAPPQIISIFTGAQMHDELLNLIDDNGNASRKREHMRVGVSTLAVLHKDEADRNRTSPFAFTGDKFEFRMVGASQSLGMPNTVLNTVVAEMLSRIADKLEGAEDKKAAWRKIIGGLIKKHERIIFNGNNYTAEWQHESEKRGLTNIKSTTDAISIMGDERVQDVFARHNVLSREELIARRDIAYWSFSQLARIEAATMLKICRQKLLPACFRYCGAVASAYNETMQAIGKNDAMKKALTQLSNKISEFDSAIEELSLALKAALISEDEATRAQDMSRKVLPLMDELRNKADALERVVDKEFWPMPSYGEMLFHIV